MEKILELIDEIINLAIEEKNTETVNLSGALSEKFGSETAKAIIKSI